MTVTEFSIYGSGEKIMFTVFWANIAEILLNIDPTNLDIETLLSSMACILVILLAATSLSAAPAWKLWQASILLRGIPGILMLLGFGIVLYFNISEMDEKSADTSVLLTLNANFLTTAISLLLYKNESIDHPDHGISST